MPLTEELRIALPRKRRGIATNLKVNRSIIVNLDTSSLDIRTNSIFIRHTLTAHWSSIITSLTDTHILNAIGKNSHDLIKIYIGLFITPRATKNITNLDISLRRLSLSYIVLVNNGSAVLTLGSDVQRTVTLGLPNTAPGSDRHDGVILGDGSGEGDEIATTDGVFGSRGSSHITVKSVSAFFRLSTGFLVDVVGHPALTFEEVVEGVEISGFLLGIDLFNGDPDHVVEFVVGVGDVVDVVHIVGTV